MKRFRKAISLIVCLLMLTAYAAGCTPPPVAEFDPGQTAGFKLPHVAGLADADNQYSYNANLFYRNETQNAGADPTCIYVSREDITDSYNKHMRTYKYRTESGEWDWIDGYSEQRFYEENGTLEEWVENYSDIYYMATTSCTSTITEKTKALYGSDVVVGAYAMQSSHDLVNWQTCGTIEGHAVAIRSDSFCATVDGNYWAPEFIRDEKTGYFFTYFSCSSKSGNRDTVYNVATSSTTDPHVGVIAISENPLGPYEIITAEEYIRIKAAKNQDGSVKTGTELITNKFSGVKYYEIYDYEGNVVGYKNGYAYYNLNGYEVNEQTPIIIPGYYYPRYVEDSPEKEAKLAEWEEEANVSIKADEKKSYHVGLIDLYPVTDENGKMYTFFTVESKYTGILYGIWVVEMIDHISPKWETLRMVVKPNVNKVVDNGTFKGDWQGTVSINEDDVTEGTAIIPHNGKWYLTYSYDYFVDVRYSVGIAVADNALGPYDKLGGAYSPVLGKGDEANDYKGGTGHHTFVKAGNELFFLYHAAHNPDNNYDPDGNYMGRHINIDRAIWKFDPSLGYDMLFCNGATVNLQPKPETYTGYENVAKYATVSGNGDVGDVSLVNDGLFTAQPFSRKFEYGKTDGGLEITLKWDSPVEVKAFQIYNAGGYYHAFNKVNTVRFKLAEKPSWYTYGEYNGYCYIKNLPVDPLDQVQRLMVVRHGSAAIAEFDPIKITEMVIYLSGDKADKYVDEDESGYVDEGYKEVHVSDVYVFGNRA